jgi:hypothetical protein
MTLLEEFGWNIIYSFYFIHRKSFVEVDIEINWNKHTKCLSEKANSILYE